MGRQGGGEFVLTNGEQFVAAQRFELRPEDVDHRRRVTKRAA
jgi:hypothetical protein